MRHLWENLYWYVLKKLNNFHSKRLLYILNNNNEIRHLLLSVPWKEKIEHGDEDDTLRAIQESLWSDNPYMKKAFWNYVTSARLKSTTYNNYVEYSANLVAEEQVQSCTAESQILEKVQQEWLGNAIGNQRLYRFIASISISLFIVLSLILGYGLLEGNNIIFTCIGGVGDLATLLFWSFYKPWNKLEKAQAKLIKTAATFDNYRHHIKACLEITNVAKRITCLKDAMKELHYNLSNL